VHLSALLRARIRSSLISASCFLPLNQFCKLCINPQTGSATAVSFPSKKERKKKIKKHKIRKINQDSWEYPPLLPRRTGEEEGEIPLEELCLLLKSHSKLI